MPKNDQSGYDVAEHNADGESIGCGEAHILNPVASFSDSIIYGCANAQIV